MTINTQPVQTNDAPDRVPELVTLRAYEVYSKVFGPQVALITGNCRGGFGVGELIAFLYARTFPENEWRERMDEALQGMEQLRWSGRGRR